MDNKINFINIVNEANNSMYVAFKCVQTGKESIGKKIYGTQFAVNGLFAIELYFKALIVLDGNTALPQQHSLQLLYNNLSKIRKSDLNKKIPYLKEFVDNNNESYTKWRFTFSCNKLSISIEETKNCLIDMKNYCMNLLEECDLDG